MQEENKVIIVFPDHWLSYSPTLINFSELLSQKKEVVILTTGKDRYVNDIFNANAAINVIFIDIKNRFLKTLIRKLDLFFISVFSRILKIKAFNNGRFRELLIGYNIENFINIIRFRSGLKKVVTPGDVLIGVDNIGVLSISKFNNDKHALSLEIAKNLFYHFIKWGRIKSLIIQTEERKKYIVPLKYYHIPTFFVQNSPIISASSPCIDKREKQRIIYLGNLAIKYNALDKIADSLQYLPQSFSLVFKGYYNEEAEAYFRMHYAELCESGRLEFDYNYLSNSDLPEYLDRFSYGITLYDIDVLPYKNFNVMSCPSGKLFNYYNSGLPVIGNDIIGLNSVRQFNAGILISNITGESIAGAIRSISNDYDSYAKRARKAAVHFDFKENINHFFLSELSLD